jgi:hypothetical protein
LTQPARDGLPGQAVLAAWLAQWGNPHVVASRTTIQHEACYIIAHRQQSTIPQANFGPFWANARA